VQQNKVGEQKLFKQFGHFSLALAIGFTTLNAGSGQSFADFKKSQQKSFQSYKDERDNEFNSYLKQQFKAYEAYVSEPLYEKPKPSTIAPTKEVHIKPVGPKVSIKIQLMPLAPKNISKADDAKKQAAKRRLEKEAMIAKQLLEQKRKDAAKAKKDAKIAAALLVAKDKAAAKAKEDARKAKLAAKAKKDAEDAAALAVAKEVAAKKAKEDERTARLTAQAKKDAQAQALIVAKEAATKKVKEDERRAKLAAKAKKDAEIAAALVIVKEKAAAKAKEDARRAKLAAKKEEAARLKEEKRLAAIIAALKAKEKVKPKYVKKDINFEFYGSKLGFNLPQGIKKASFYPKNQKGIASFFDIVASSEYENLIKDIKTTSKDMNLNDWGVYLLVLKLSDNIFAEADDSKLMSWFIFNKLGYAVKVGLAKKHIVLMHYSKKIIYSTPNYSFGKRKYYVVANYAKGSVGRLFSYKQDYPGSTKPLDLSLRELPNLVSDTKEKTLSFKQFGKTYKVPFSYNKNLINFMSTYPQADYDVFFNAPLSDITYKDIALGLKKYVDGKKASDAMNFVLNFVQKSFKYERDNQQFGREKVMFAEETLYFDKSDCEDRAILFSYLMKELFHVPVVGVKYSDHMATALYVPIRGDKVMANNKTFVVADPTYINANIGMSMPKYRSIKPQSYIIVKKN